MKNIAILFLTLISLSSMAHDFVCKLPAHYQGFESSEEFIRAEVRVDGVDILALSQFAQTFGSERYQFSRLFLIKSSNTKQIVYSENLEHETFAFEFIVPRHKNKFFTAELNFIHNNLGLVNKVKLDCSVIK